jgi:hypothetical protein
LVSFVFAVHVDNKTMWEPKGFGAFIGWLAAAATAVYFLSGEMVRAGFFGEACRQYGLDSFACGVVPNMVVALPNSFVYFLELPFKYDASADWIGAGFMWMAMGSSVAYGLALVAVNYWVWKLNQL